ncbi:MAG: endolytic transglycosylase MltG [bacterium (Candidatus Ratteibacteria) CG_4_9_14_3_um_filter_41_21]|uniref:Endolytic murein transglycosylase n=2 Tax=Candidatus Ratteibacteria TaxID=2979319 RepID=A0A2M7YHE7_9BACT|nr:MAG: endolytic transglycosylase MltG [bacterium (Candidatus Ratteibacteria) CG_4_9_14_3_um_filter_41_21]HCG76295.1 endolytic transglycosylase MltG [bacterium]
MKKKYKIFLFVVIAFFFLSLFFFIGNKKFSKVKIIRISPKLSSRAIASLLKEEGIIKSENLFILLLKLTGKEKRLQAGLYELKSWSTPLVIINKLAKGEVAIISFTIPEGYTVVQIANLLEKKKLCSAEDFIKIANERELEGFLFPARYTIPSSVSVEGIISIMQEKFKEVINGYQEKLKGKSLKNIVILASIIEKEAQKDSGRPIVASVLYNRLKKHLPLESCVTIEYALGEHKARLSSKDLLLDSPYNTYRKQGLPPGPICNPGKASLEAAISPAKTKFLFFVSKGDGTHTFSETYTQHLIGKEKLQKAGKSN